LIYFILVDHVSGEKRYAAHFNIDQIDQRLNSILTSNFSNSDS
jgi:hypothetical protein